MRTQSIDLPEAAIHDFCRKYHLRSLALFGSVLREDFGPESDIDMLVEFEPGHEVGLITFAHMANELGDLLGYKVDLNTPASLSPYFKDEVLKEAETIYAAA